VQVTLQSLHRGTKYMPEPPMDQLEVIEGEDAAEISERFRGWRVELIHLGRGRIQRAGTVVAFGDGRITGVHFGRAVLLRGASPRGFASLLYSQASMPPVRVASRAVGSETCLVIGGLAPVDIYLPEGSSTCIVSIASAGTSRPSSPLENLPACGVTEFRSLPARHSTLLDECIDVLESVRHADVSQLAGTAAQLRLRELLLPVAAALFADSTALPAESDDKAIRRLAVLRACAHIDAHLREPITLTELCEIAGARARTLEYGFREFYEVGPMTYLKTVRLCRVRRDLSDPRLINGPVATTARRWCFSHMGQFSRDYRLLFGESPSTTLTRTRQLGTSVPPDTDLDAKLSAP
jgi:AraC-like DNA-binding protein